MVKIGSLELVFPTVLAPMAAYTDIVMRRMLDQIGGVGLMVSEMISVEGLCRRNQRTMKMIRGFSSQTPQCIQLFGRSISALCDAVRLVQQETDFKAIDINMGCPVPKVVKRGCGAGLLKNPTEIKQILAAVRSVCQLPLTIKIRLGFNEINAAEVIRLAAAEGVDAIHVHFRMKGDNYSVPACWEIASSLRELSPVPLIGNGDIFSVEVAKERLQMVEAIMIGRGAISNPFIFAELAGIVQSDESELKRILINMAELIELYWEPRLQLGRIKTMARFIFNCQPHAKRIRQAVYACTNYSDVKKILHQWLDIPEAEVLT